MHKTDREFNISITHKLRCHLCCALYSEATWEKHFAAWVPDCTAGRGGGGVLGGSAGFKMGSSQGPDWLGCSSLHFTEGHTVSHFPLGFLTCDSRGGPQQQQQQRPATGHVFMTGQEQAQLLLALIHQRISHLQWTLDCSWTENRLC